MGLIMKENKKSITASDVLSKLWAYVLLSLIGVCMIMPFLWMLSTSLKDPGSVYTYPPKWIPDPFVFGNYLKVWRMMPFARFFLNSVIVSVFMTLGQVITSSLAAYAFARMEFPGRDKLFLCYLGTLMIPGQVTMIPVFNILRVLGWLDSYKALILPGIFTAYGTFMLRQFFLTIPKELEEAAILDGFTRWEIYYKIILPLSKPALATLSTFVFLGAWNEFMWSLIVIRSEEMKTLPIALASLQGLYTTDWTLLMAASTTVLLPVLFVYMFNQRFITRGIVMSGLKG